MGSSGTGRFGDYFKGKEMNKEMCAQEINKIILEDVGILDYYNKNSSVPPIMKEVYLNNQLHHNSRLSVCSKETNQIIGLLPSKYNKLLACIRMGYQYKGSIIFSISTPIPRVEINLYATN